MKQNKYPIFQGSFGFSNSNEMETRVNIGNLKLLPGVKEDTLKFRLRNPNKEMVHENVRRNQGLYGASKSL